jgi:hypothetical protein
MRNPRSQRTTGFDPLRTYVHLTDGGEARIVPVPDDFWQTIGSRTDLHGGRLVSAYRFATGADWDHWERHPAGDEIVSLFSGALDLVLDEDGGRRVVELRGRSMCVVPRGAWHFGIVHEPSEALFITQGQGTEHRPVSKGDRP